jgi:uncharacterized UBP type Zn finger protein
MSKPVCKHLTQTTELIQPTVYVCDECVKHGGEWVHLRTCQTCGTTLCCDSSPHKHATAHYHATQHPVVISAEPGERWLWCYEDEVFGQY